MCGIAGIFNFKDEACLSDLQLMSEAIQHRGPDGSGVFCNKNLAFSHRRLAIIDPTDAGKQPMVSADGRYVLSYNGEIYNFKEIREELKSLGYLFISDTDTEVLLYAWAQWQQKCVHRLNGMFAFSIWDSKEQKLFLVRDRYGIKPLYYSFNSKGLLFASESKSIRSNPNYSRNLDIETVKEYFTFQNIFTNNTFDKDIKMLPPATIASISIGQFSLDFFQYWDYKFAEPQGDIDKHSYTEELSHLLRQAVNRQLVSDVELGSYLSGGMDSGTITSIASNNIPNLNTFTCGFDLSSASGLELAFDERRLAEHMSAEFNTEHYEMVLKAGDMERSLPLTAKAIEEPRVGQSYPNYYIAKLASKFVKVVLSGTGGDELFAGYPWRYYRASTSSNFDDYIDKYYSYWQRLLSTDEHKRVFLSSKGEKEFSSRKIFKDVFASYDQPLNTPQDHINHSLYFECKTFLHGLLVVEDKLSMAHSLETRVPFLDNDLVDFAMKCPVDLKVNNLMKVIKLDENIHGDKKNEFFKRSKDGKQILRDAMNMFIPEEIISQPKQGFSSPDASWFRGESLKFVEKSFLRNDALIFELMEKNTIVEMVKEHLSGKKNRRLLIWSLLNFEQLLKEF
tara:strand:+ start:10722 stop:12584 length:1863 start_codon:yes stop_codon:yes gene_type:complete